MSALTFVRKKSFPAVLLFVAAFLIYKLILLDRLGFCYKELRFVSSEELILSHLDGLMKSVVMKIPEHQDNARQYFADHPECCSVSWGSTDVFSRGLICFGSATVSITYELSTQGRERSAVPEGSKESYYQLLLNDTACGETLGYVGTTTVAPVARK